MRVASILQPSFFICKEFYICEEFLFAKHSLFAKNTKGYSFLFYLYRLYKFCIV